MRLSIRLRFTVPALLAAWPALAQTGDPIAALRADRWADAQAAAAGYADPVAVKLVTYYRLLAPGAATADEITSFIAQNPDWPNQPLLELRRQEAIVSEPDLAATLSQCERDRLTLPQAMLHCAEAEQNAGRREQANEDARRAWIAGVADDPGFLRRWSGALGPEDQWERFQHLAWRDIATASKQVTRLDPPHRAAAEARIALRQNAPNAEVLLAAVPAALRAGPGLMLDHARWLLRADRYC